MRRLAWFCLLVATCLTAPAADAPRAARADRAARMLLKADEILRQAAVVSTRAVGYGGACSEANWALSVICASKDDPVGHLLDLSSQCRPAGFVMCLMGVRLLDEKRFANEFAARSRQLQETGLTVETGRGCVFVRKSAIVVFGEHGWDRESLIPDPIPELWETIRLFPTTDSLDGKADLRPVGRLGAD